MHGYLSHYFLSVQQLISHLIKKSDNFQMCIRDSYIAGSYWRFKNFEVVGTQVAIKGHTQSEVFRIEGGNNNILENIDVVSYTHLPRWGKQIPLLCYG